MNFNALRIGSLCAAASEYAGASTCMATKTPTYCAWSVPCTEYGHHSCGIVRGHGRGLCCWHRRLQGSGSKRSELCGHDRERREHTSTVVRQLCFKLHRHGFWRGTGTHSRASTRSRLHVHVLVRHCTARIAQHHLCSSDDWNLPMLMFVDKYPKYTWQITRRYRSCCYFRLDARVRLRFVGASCAVDAAPRPVAHALTSTSAPAPAPVPAPARVAGFRFDCLPEAALAAAFRFVAVCCAPPDLTKTSVSSVDTLVSSRYPSSQNSLKPATSTTRCWMM